MQKWAGCAVRRRALAELLGRLPELMDPADLAEALAADMLDAASVAQASKPAPAASPLRRRFAPAANRAEPDSGDFASAENRHYHDKRDRLGRFVAAGGYLDEADNIKSGADAIAIAKRRGGQDVRDAMSRRGLGRIHFVWGRPGDPKPPYDELEQVHPPPFHDGYGISHALSKHGDEALKALPGVVAKGTIAPDRNGNPYKRVISHGPWMAIVHSDVHLSGKERDAIRAWEIAKNKHRRNPAEHPDPGGFPVDKPRNKKESFALTSFRPDRDE